jgi:PAS domain S-box-containing protein
MKIDLTKQLTDETPDAIVATTLEGTVVYWNNGAESIVIANLTGRIVLANGQAEKLFNYQRKELPGKPVEALLPSRFRASHVGDRANYFSQPHTDAMGAGLKLYGLHKGGKEFPVEISLSTWRPAKERWS